MEDQVFVSFYLSPPYSVTFLSIFYFYPQTYSQVSANYSSVVLVLLGIFVVPSVLRFQISLQKKRCKYDYRYSVGGKTTFWS